MTKQQLAELADEINPYLDAAHQKIAENYTSEMVALLVYLIAENKSIDIASFADLLVDLFVQAMIYGYATALKDFTSDNTRETVS